MKHFQEGTSSEGVFLARSDNPPKVSKKRPHNFSHVVDKNMPGARF